MPKVTIHDFRIADRVLAETDPGAGDVVFVGTHGSIAYPFVVNRRLSGPGGVYIDALDIIDADGRSLGVWEHRFEIDGESKPRNVLTEIRNVKFPQPGTYMLQYSIYDDVIATFPFTVAAEDAPAAGIVPGPLDAALAKGTICWLVLDDKPTPDPLMSGKSVKVPEYKQAREIPVWYGYEDGRIYVLVGEGEQKVPGLAEASSVWVVARSKDKQSKVAEVECGVETFSKDDARWETIARDVLVGRRLNLRDGDAAPTRWRKECEIYVLTPLTPAAEREAQAAI